MLFCYFICGNIRVKIIYKYVNVFSFLSRGPTENKCRDICIMKDNFENSIFYRQSIAGKLHPNWLTELSLIYLTCDEDLELQTCPMKLPKI